MKILILTVSFLILGAILVQEQEQSPLAEKTEAKIKAQIFLHHIASDIPKTSYFSQQNQPRYEKTEVEAETYPLISDSGAWENEMFEILMAYDPENGESIIASYVMEKKRHENDFNESLEMSIHMLSDLNGESGYSKQELETEVADLERTHSSRVKNIMGDHYDYLQEKRQQFREPSDL